MKKVKLKRPSHTFTKKIEERDGQLDRHYVEEELVTHLEVGDEIVPRRLGSSNVEVTEENIEECAERLSRPYSMFTRVRKRSDKTTLYYWVEREKGL